MAVDELVGEIETYLSTLDADDEGTDELPQEDEDDRLAPVDFQVLFPSRFPRQWSDDEIWGWDLPLDDLPETLWPGFRVGERQAARRSVLAGDTDRCAWYRSIAFHGVGFGVFVKQECMLRVASELAPWVFAPGHTLSYGDVGRLILSAFAYLFLHEQFHHKVDSFAIRLAIVERRLVYRRYWRDAYLPAKGTDDLLEEALATADAYRRVSRATYSRVIGRRAVQGLREYLDAVIPFSPPGYRLADRHLRGEDFDRGEARLQAIVQEAALSPRSDWIRWDLAQQLTRSLVTISSHVYQVVPASRAPILPVGPPITESTRVVARLLRSLGFEKRAKRGKGSHEVWVRKGAKPASVTLPRQANLTPGVLSSIARSLGYSSSRELVMAARNV